MMPVWIVDYLEYQECFRIHEKGQPEQVIAYIDDTDEDLRHLEQEARMEGALLIWKS